MMLIRVLVLCGMMMTGCDVGAIAKPWEVQHKMAKLVADEFFDQGDLEKLQLNTQPVAMMDRERKDELPQMQVGFIDVICLPLYKTLAETFPWIQPLYEGTLDNRNHWQDLAEKVEMGLTWIDHDVIEKPVEEFQTDQNELEDIEFTVTTLNCDKKVNQPEEIDGAQQGAKRGNGSMGKFTSLRKNRSLGRSVKTRISRSLYSRASSQPEDTSEEHGMRPETMQSKPKAAIQQKTKSRLCSLF